jgi:hypothetical protein
VKPIRTPKAPTNRRELIKFVDGQLIHAGGTWTVTLSGIVLPAVPCVRCGASSDHSSTGGNIDGTYVLTYSGANGVWSLDAAVGVTFSRYSSTTTTCVGLLASTSTIRFTLSIGCTADTIVLNLIGVGFPTARTYRYAGVPCDIRTTDTLDNEDLAGPCDGNIAIFGTGGEAVFSYCP